MREVVRECGGVGGVKVVLAGTIAVQFDSFNLNTHYMDVTTPTIWKLINCFYGGFNMLDSSLTFSFSLFLSLSKFKLHIRDL